tara:strand:+ start:9868 stop:10227 length:360 start_codon:yes stop_codon:yes gene_type:complete
MRIDLFLWYTRIFKSRTIASNACKKGHVKIEAKSIKPSFDVFNGSSFSVKKKQILYNFHILDLPSSRVGAKIVDLYLKDLTPKSENEKKEILNKYKNNFKYESKPSKKERRDINEFLNE